MSMYRTNLKLMQRAIARRTSPSAVWRTFTSTRSVNDGGLADQCDLRIVSSPFPPIDKSLLDLPVPELVMSNWKAKGGTLGDELAIVDGSTGMSRTYSDFYNSATGLAATFKYDMNVEEKDSVCLFAPNHVDYLPVTLAAGLCGAKLTPVNPMYTKGELLSILDRSRSTVLVAHVAILDVALEAAKASQYVKHVVVMTENGQLSPVEGVARLDSITSHPEAFDTTFRETHPELEHHPFLLPYSSGTTGLPKGVCLSHTNINANLQQYNIIESMNMDPGEVIISPLPFFHIYGQTVISLHSGWNGNPVVTMSGRFDLQRYCELVEEYKPTRSYLVPPILLGLAKHPMIDKYDLSSTKFVCCAAAPCSGELQAAAEARLGCQVKQGFGMSELSPVANVCADNNIKTCSVGPLVPSSYGKVVDDDGKSLGPDEDGELCIKGPHVMMGYLDDPENTAKCLSPNGWLLTGDIGHYDDEGHFFITDRKKELIKVKGFQVPPAELEALLLSNDLVMDAAVIQIPDEEAGELPRAYIVLKDPSLANSDTEMEIYNWVKDKVVHYKRLDGGIVFIDAVPKSASGKILRRDKIFTGVACVGAAVQGVFFAEYEVEGFEGQDHVFSGIQREARVFVDRNIYGIDPSKTAAGGNVPPPTADKSA
eukprot:Nitzschia sp. Nitz4//scaffold34_size148208//81741//84340//NITZ4_002985-RA/size148208-processed-gene-0.49-mRNA-1//-1//CDS//3329548810//7658//frame0